MSEQRGDSQPLLRVRGLEQRFRVAGGGLFGGQPRFLRAVAGVDLDLRRGETLGLVGESGCGKSTLGRSVLQLLKPSAGSVQFDGVELTTLWERRFGRERWGEGLRQLRRRMQMVFQDPYSSLDPRMTIEQIVAEPLHTFGLGEAKARRARVQSLLERVGMDPRYLRRYPHEFSGGQRQRVGIARALALEPELLVCDEPISALDVSIQAQVLNLLKQLQRELGLTYLFIAHDVAAVRYVSDRIAVMYLGRIVELGDVNQICTAPRHPYTQALIAAVPQPDPARERSRRHLPLMGEIPSALEPPSGCAFHTRCPRVVARCRSERPELVGPPDGPRVACHLAD
jgi:oligopeptide/dipeptide ABC transporter ATP-binding protein